MAVDDFLMVTPPGWFEIPDATAKILAWGEGDIVLAAQELNWGTFESFLEATGDLPLEHNVVEARLFNTGAAGAERLRLWAKYAPYQP